MIAGKDFFPVQAIENLWNCTPDLNIKLFSVMLTPGQLVEFKIIILTINWKSLEGNFSERD